MNCQDAREQFDAARPDSPDRTGSEFAAARNHVAECASCLRVVGIRERLDRQISRLMRDVPVPSGLKARILDSLNTPATVPAAKADDNQLQDTTSQPASSTRRRWLAAAAMIAAAVVLSIPFWPSSSKSPSRLTLADLRQEAALELADLDPFNGSFKPKLPGGIWNSRNVRFSDHAKGDMPDRDGLHRIALFEFWVRDVRGVMLVIPKDQLENPPSNEMPSFQDRAENYARRPSRTYHSFAWQSDGYVYICFVPKDGHSLDTLSRAISGPNA